MMDRRTFISALAGGWLSAPLGANAQAVAKIYRIGILGNENSPPWEGLRRGLRDLGYADGATSRWNGAGRRGGLTASPPLRLNSSN